MQVWRYGFQSEWNPSAQQPQLQQLLSAGIQAPLRALLLDLTPPEQQKKGQALFGLFTGLGQMIG